MGIIFEFLTQGKLEVLFPADEGRCLESFTTAILRKSLPGLFCGTILRKTMEKLTE